MANLEQIIANKNAIDTQWQLQQQAERAYHRSCPVYPLLDLAGG